MDSMPTINELILESCCVNSLKRIREILDTGNLLYASLIPAYLFVLFRGGGHIAQTIHGVATTDWAQLKKLPGQMKAHSRRQVARICYLEAIAHHNGKLRIYWLAMHDVFK